MPQRIEIITREINAMTDSDQQQILKLWFLLFRPQNLQALLNDTGSPSVS